ncbi:hypothetical protein MUJ63_02440 [Lachnospiraceae bacterium NSJ-143]|nr:hypothetical protein [Lachnospiraceae bacterium NSJ-143]
MEFYFSGDLTALREYIDLDSLGLSDKAGTDKTEFRFFVGDTPHKDDLLIKMKADGSFDQEYDVFGGRFVFVVSPEPEKLKSVLKEAEEEASKAPFFPIDWEEDGSDRYVLSYCLCFENIRECVKFAYMLMNGLDSKGFFDMDMQMYEPEFFADSEHIKIIKNCGSDDIKSVQNLHGTLAVFYCDSNIDGLEYMSGLTDDMYNMLLSSSDSKSHFLQMFYIEGETYLEYYYWKDQL